MLTSWATADLVSAAQAGDEKAAEELVGAVWPRCFRLAATILGDRDLAQDAAQEACVVVYRKIRNLRAAGAFDTWLYRIIMREAARVRRRHGVSAQLAEVAQPASDDPTTVDVWRALSELGPTFREVTVLYYFEDLKTEEIASILGVRHATVRTRLARSRVRLRSILGDYQDRLDSSSPEVPQYAV